MNVNDGSILGMGSYPTFDPGIFTPPVSQDKIKTLQNNDDAIRSSTARSSPAIRRARPSS